MIDPEATATLALFGHELPKRGIDLPLVEDHCHGVADLADHRGLLAFHQHGLKHAANAEVAAVDQAQLDQCIDQKGITGGWLVVEDVVLADPSDEATVVT